MQFLNKKSLKFSCLTLLFLSTPIYTQPSLAQLSVVQNRSITETNQSVQLDDPYTLGTGDQISIQVFESPEYSGEYLIPIGGVLNLPLIGSITVEGMTLKQLTDEISSRYSRVLKRPIVTVNLVSPRPVTVSIVGEVNLPGKYTLNLNIARGGLLELRYPSLTEAIDQAQGTTLAADLRQIQIRRLQRSGVEKIISVNLWEFLQTGNPTQNINLRDGDTVFIPTLTEVNLLEARQLGAGMLDTLPKTPVQIAVVGEVVRSGSYTLLDTGDTPNTDAPKRPTVTGAIQAAGGVTQMANIREIQVRRITKANTEQTITVDLWQLLETGDLTQDTFLQDGDTVVIPRVREIDPLEASQLATTNFSPNTIKVYVVGEVVEPGIVEVPPNTPLNQALLAAGSFRPGRAKNNFVELIRLNPNGTVSQQKIPIDLSEGINEETNPMLRNNDVIVVSPSFLAKAADRLDLVVGNTRLLGVIRLVEGVSRIQFIDRLLFDD